jgi:hypothetical protein
VADRVIQVPEAAGKTISVLNFLLSASGESEVHIEFKDGTSFSGTICPRIKFEGELYVGGIGEPQVLKRYDENSIS